MKVDNITFAKTNTKRRSLINSQNTGYAAAAGVVLAVASGVVKNKTMRKSHKYISVFAALATVLHIFSVEYYKHMFKKGSIR